MRNITTKKDTQPEVPAKSVAEIARLIRDSALTQSEIADQSGLSRVQINRIANKRVSSIQPATADRLLAALSGCEGSRRHPEDTTGLAGRVYRYRKLVEERLSKKSFAGLGLPDLHPQALDSIFVAAKALRCVQSEVTDASCELDALAAGVARDRYEKALGEGSEVDIAQVIRANPRLIIQGCPGSGKSTILQHTAVQVAQGTFFGDLVLPVFIRLPEFASALEIDPRVDFFSWIQTRGESAGADRLGSFLKEWLEASRDHSLIFFLDGLDEVPEDQLRQASIDKIVEFVIDHPTCRYVVTSRPIGFDPSPWLELDFESYRLVEYSNEQIAESVSKWSKVLGVSKDGDEYELREAIWAHPRVLQIARNPLILTILIFLCRSRGYAMPRRRVDLYAKVADVFMESWEASKRQTSEFTETLDIDLDARELSWLVSDLALRMQRSGLVTAKRWWVERCWQEALVLKIGFSDEAARDATSRLIRFVSGRNGIFEERALELYAFSHRTMQEYFAALGIVNESDIGGNAELTRAIRPYLFHPEWSETIMLIASTITPPRAEKLVRLMLDDVDPSGRLLWRGHKLALRCLLDGATIADRRLVRELFDSTKSLGRSRWLGVTMEVLHLLRCFERSRYAESAQAASNCIIETAQECLSDDEFDQIKRSTQPFKIRAKKRKEGVSQKQAVIEYLVAHGDVEEEIFLPNIEFLSEDSEAWHQAAIKILGAPDASEDVKATVLVQIASQASVHKRSRIRLRHELRESTSPKLRRIAVRGLSRCRDSSWKLLVKCLLNDPDRGVRAEAAEGLSTKAKSEPSVSERLVAILSDDDEEVRVRCGAAIGLSEVASLDPKIATRLVDVADTVENKKLKFSAIQSLRLAGATNGAVFDRLKEWAFLESGESRMSSQVLSRLLSENDSLWDQQLVERVEGVLRSLGDESKTELGAPCSHALSALELLVDARESRCEMQVETLIQESLCDLQNRIRYAFIFGSVARTEQHSDSDIDLMVIGEATLKELSPKMKRVENATGREVNLTAYREDSFARRFNEGNAFILEVMRSPKLPICVGGVQYTREEIDSELRELAAERMASA